jgi:hypothetical protein
VQLPEQDRIRVRHRHVPRPQVAVAITLEKNPVHHHRRSDRGSSHLPLPTDVAGLAFDGQHAARRGREVDEIAVQGRGRPAAARPLEADLSGMYRPQQRIPRPRRIELHQLPQLVAALVEALVFAGHVQVAGTVDHDGRVGVVPRPETEDTPHAGAAGEYGRDVPTLHEAPGIGEVHDPVVERDRALDRDLSVAEHSEQLVVEARHRRHDLRRHGDQSDLVVAAVQSDDVQPPVLTSNEQDIVDHERRPVPIVVAKRPTDAGRTLHRPQDERLATPVHRDDPEPSVT